MTVEIDAGVAIEAIESPSHAIETTGRGPGRVTVTLGRHDRIPNKDLVLRYKVAGGRIKAGLMTHRDERGGFFTLMLVPPESLSSLPAAPLELVFVLDGSGSMSGAPIAKAKAAIERALRRLRAGDTFQIIRFSNSASRLGPAPLPATPANVRRGLAYLRSIGAGGGTMMIEGIKAALDSPHDPRRLRVVSFMTDGFIGNEAEILAAVRARIGDARIFSFGVGSSVNRYLLEGMARLGRGAVTYVGLDESAGRQVDLFYERIRHPALTDIALDGDAMRARDVFPRRIPDLFPGRPIVVTGRFDGEAATTVRVTGKIGGERHEIRIPVPPESRGTEHPGIPRVWARRQIMSLMDDMAVTNDPALAARVKRVALRYGLMSAYTAFVAVDSRTRTRGDHGTTVPVAVPVPEGVRYETTVRDDAAGG